MPWSDFPSDIRAFSGLVQAAAQQRFGAAATAQIVSLAAKAAGINLSFQSYTGLAKLYGNYVAGRSAQEAIATAAEVQTRTGMTQGIDSSMMWTPPYGPAPGQLATSPFALVKVGYVRDTPTGAVAGVFSHQYHVADLTSIEGILSDVQAQIDTATGDTNLQGAQATQILSIERTLP